MVSAIQSALGFTFRARAARGKNGKSFTSLLPVVSKDALATMSAQVRARWRLHLRTWHTMGSLAREINRIPSGQDDKSRVTGDCQAQICRAPGLSCLGLPDLRVRAQGAEEEP
jgi:hypothetical protein